jgi:hypothetical protein
MVQITMLDMYLMFIAFLMGATAGAFVAFMFFMANWREGD